MDPLIPSYRNLPKGAGDPVKEHDSQVLKLCVDAYQLAVLMRKSRATYRCESCNEGTLIDEKLEPEISAQAFEGVQAPTINGSKIALTIFGSLVKYSELDERHVLEKSHVICRVFA